MAFGSPFLFSGTTVWHTAIRVRNSRITGAVTCGEHHKVTKFTVLRRGTLHVLAGTIYPECKKSELTWFLFKFSISDGSLKPCTSSSPHLEKTKHTFKYRVLNTIWIFYILNWNIAQILLSELVKLLKHLNLTF